MGALRTLGLVVNLPPLLQKLDTVDVENLFYSSMIQGGIELFEVPPLKDYPFPESAFVSERVKFFSEETFKKSCQPIMEVFGRYLPGGYEEKEKYSNEKWTPSKNKGEVFITISDLYLGLWKMKSCRPYLKK